ncbi:MAG: hypothetical protein U0942_03345 [Parvibaculum sp.]|uniref:hypothetical protein n=1 Tax=Parvibaculum sp. TaxID=2024848 RepID=UPI002AB800A2|nr:hypothetical protein [Parvibaculum sp.]MDZ4380357.1 hypothetical protein [Parvibaculum sp.]
MRTFKIVIAAILAALLVGVTGAIYLQSEGAAMSVGSLLALVLLSFVYDNRSQLFGGGAATARAPGGKAGVAIGQATALTRFGEGEVRGTPGYKGG